MNIGWQQLHEQQESRIGELMGQIKDWKQKKRDDCVTASETVMRQARDTAIGSGVETLNDDDSVESLKRRNEQLASEKLDVRKLYEMLKSCGSQIH